jgi:hypothetical protein
MLGSLTGKDNCRRHAIIIVAEHFGIPSFISFNEIDPIIDLYKEERIKIKNIYKDKDFLDLTLQKLKN